MTVLDLYNESIRPLPTGERFKLATMILNDISPQSVADYQDAWTDEDLKEFSLAAWRRADEDAGGGDDASR